MSVENQRTLTIRTPKVGENGKSFVQVDLEDLQLASKLLTAKQLIIYMDLCGNKDGYNYDFSPAYYKKNYNISVSTAQDAFKALEAVGYITKENEKYFFNRKPMTA